ncbi:MAG: endonuclease III [Elusimicrobiales bacterium]
MPGTDIKKILAALRREFPKAETALRHSNPFELLAATILSAQCTDERVNRVTPALFARYPSPAAFAAAKETDVEALMYSTGFYKNKARAIISASAAIVEKFGGKVPDTMDGLLSLRGVARKTANVVLGSAFGKAEGIVVDTHVKRLAFRLGLSDNTAPEKIEQDLMRLISRKDWIWFAHALVLHGRKTCKARGPDCANCALSAFCPKRGL